MPTKPIHLILLLTLLLAGCAPAAAAETPTPLPSRTAAPPSPTRTPTATLTPVPPTATLSPTPTLSPTITMTPLPFNACPVTDEEYRYPFPEVVDSPKELGNHILEALNNGITFTNLKESVDQIICKSCPGSQFDDGFVHYRYENTISARELTGDGVEEILFSNFGAWHIYTCKQGKYIMPLSMNRAMGYNDEINFLDLNKNTIPDILMYIYVNPLHGPSLLYIYEWDGEKFRNLILPNEIYQRANYPDAFVTYAPSWVDEIQSNSDGISKVIIRGLAWRFGTNDATFGPYRDYYLTLTWDGTHFQAGFKEPAPAKYRFQAVEDGDWETWRGNYDQAMAYYNQALNDPALESWGDQECQEQWKDAYYSLEEGQPTPTPCPPDPNEQAVLKAYLHYRYMLIYTAQGKETLARNEYLALTQLDKSHPAYPFKELASAFWEEYQVTQDLVIACTKAKELARKIDFHSTIGNSWYVWKMPTHELICPFEGDLDELVDWD